MLKSSVVAMSARQPVYKRQQFLLALIQHLNGRVLATDLQKIVFLYSMASGTSYYDFVPYKYGAYSFQLAQDIEVLCKNGYMTEENKLTSPENYSPTVGVDAFAVESLRGDALIRKAYEHYPYYAIRSEIAERVLDVSVLRVVQAESSRLAQKEQMLFSIGYEGKSIEGFINILLRNGINLLCDVRRNPLSRKFGFSRGILKHIAESVGIAYVHIPALGIDSGDRQALKTQEDYTALFAGYRESLFVKKEALQQVHQLLMQNVRVALMCYEQDPNCCHRTIVKEYLTDNYSVKSKDIGHEA